MGFLGEYFLNRYKSDLNKQFNEKVKKDISTIIGKIDQLNNLLLATLNPKERNNLLMSESKRKIYFILQCIMLENMKEMSFEEISRINTVIKEIYDFDHLNKSTFINKLYVLGRELHNQQLLNELANLNKLLSIYFSKNAFLMASHNRLGMKSPAHLFFKGPLADPKNLTDKVFQFLQEPICNTVKKVPTA